MVQRTKCLTEAELQKKIIDHFIELGYFAIKLIQTNVNGIPDLMCLKNGTTTFIEVKKKGKKATLLQLYRHEQLRNNGFEVLVIDNIFDIKK